MNLRALGPGLLAGAVFILLSPYKPWGLPFPDEIGAQNWMKCLKSWLDHLGVFLSLCLVSIAYVPRLRDKEVRVAVFLWLAAGSSLHSGPPLGMAMLGVVLLWSVLLAGDRVVHGGAKAALGAHLLVLGAPSVAITAAPLGVYVAVDRLGHRKDMILLVGGLALGALVIWHFDLISRNRFIYLWSEVFFVLDKPLSSWSAPLAVLLSDPVLWMAFPGCIFLRRIGVSRWLRITLAATMAMGLVCTVATGAQSFFTLSPVFALAIGAFLDREIAARSLWYGVVLGSVVAAIHLDHFRTVNFSLVQPWWVHLGVPVAVGVGLQILVAAASLYLIVRSAMRVGGWKARLVRAGASVGVGVLTALIIAGAHRLV